MRPELFDCRIIENKMLTPTVFELKFETDRKFSFEAGQFVSIVIPGAAKNGRDLRRAYSIASSPEQYPIELCITKVEGGPGSTYLSQLKPGDLMKAYAPYGKFVYQTPSTRMVCFVSTGTGIAPFRSMILSEKFGTTPPRKALCLFGARYENEMLYETEIKDSGKAEWMACITRPSDHFKCFKGRVTDYLRNTGSDFAWTETDFYLCGNGAMIQEIKTLLLERGVDKSAIHQEAYFNPNASGEGGV